MSRIRMTTSLVGELLGYDLRKMQEMPVDRYRCGTLRMAPNAAEASCIQGTRPKKKRSRRSKKRRKQASLSKTKKKAQVKIKIPEVYSET